MVLDYKYFTEKQLTYILMSLVDEEERFMIDYRQILNNAKDINGYYHIELPNGKYKINKETGVVE